MYAASDYDSTHQTALNIHDRDFEQAEGMPPALSSLFSQ